MRELYFAIAVFFVVLFLSSVPHARDLDGRYAGGPNKTWFDGLHSGLGPCCSDADGNILADVDWELRDGHYRVRINNQWWDVPDEAVLKQPNLDGRTIVWPLYYNDGTNPIRIQIRCFIVVVQG